MFSRRISFLALITLVFILALAGCAKEPAKTPDKKMMPPAGSTQIAPKTETKTSKDSTLTRKSKEPVVTTSISESRKLAEKLTKMVVDVKGVNSTTIVVHPINNNFHAMVGLTPDSDIKGEGTEAVKNEVTKTVKNADKRISLVLVTTNPDLVKRIEDIARGVLAGKPIQSFADEISELTRRMAPSLK